VNGVPPAPRPNPLIFYNARPILVLAGFCEVFNLGTGRPSSVLEAVAAFRAASGCAIPYEVGPRRPGDAPSSYADPTKAKAVLGWEATLVMADMCRDAWRWVSLNPKGYGDAGKLQ
jgi:UDP-glucose 4-epimerase